MTTSEPDPDVTPEMISAFKTAWAEADNAGRVGARVEAGLRAAFNVSSDQRTDERPVAPLTVARVELFTDTTGDHRWRAIARNGEIVATSGEGYRNAAHARAMAERILPGVEIRDEEADRG